MKSVKLPNRFKKTAGLITVALVSLFISVKALAQTLEIDITGGVEGGVPVAVVPFQNVSSSPQNVSDIISADLTRSGRFDILPKSSLVAQPYSPEQINVTDWRLLGQNAVVIGSIFNEGGAYRIEYSLFDTALNQVIDSFSFNASQDQLRRVAHQISDRVYEKMTGIPGAFDTKLAYVLTKGRYKDKTYELQVSDSDGYNQFAVYQTSKPIISPAWTPDGQQLAYTVIENGQQRIYLHNIYTGSRSVLAEFKGVNTSPTFSPDGRRMAFTSSKDGNAEIYLMDLGSRNVTRLTNDRGIDTEPSFSADGRSIVFTSDRTGRPQVYQMGVYGGTPQRLTFQGKQNGKPEYSGRSGNVVLVTNHGNGDQVALLNQSGMKILSRGPVDDSPTYAPNGEMILYAGKSGNTGVLSVVSELGRQSYQLTFNGGDVKDPAWSPRLN